MIGVNRVSMSRRRFVQLSLGGAAIVLSANSSVYGAPKPGGNATVAQQGYPTSLDWQITDDEPSRNVNSYVYELLVTRDEHMKTIADLAEWTASPDGLQYTFNLRQGVLFHNGKELTAGDAKASLERFARIGLDKAILAPVDSIEARDKYTVDMKMKHPVPTFIEQLSSVRNPCAIIPAEEAAKPGGQIEPIGTGPYQVGTAVAGSHVELKKFDRYQPNDKYAHRDGFGGKKIAYFDTVTFRNVSESGSRVAGLLTGEYDVVDNIPLPVANRLSSNPKVKILRILPWGMLTEYVNANYPPTDKLDVRRAIQVALDMDQIMKIATDGLYQLDSGFQYAKFPYYIEGPGKPLYNAHDPARAKQYLKEAGYSGEKLALVTNSTYQHLYKATVVIRDQLRAVGMNVDIQVYDWATSLAKLREPAGWNLWSDSLGLAPGVGDVAGVMRRFTGAKNFQHHDDPVLDKLFADLTSGSTLEARRAAFAKMQARVDSQVYAIRLGDEGYVQATRSRVENFVPYRVPRMWNVWFSA
jgi:peptide/nickel transport system substrate-binding protein